MDSKISSNKGRNVRAWAEDDATDLLGVIITEKVRITRLGYSNGTWDENRIYLTREELAKLAALYPVEVKS